MKHYIESFNLKKNETTTKKYIKILQLRYLYPKEKWKKQKTITAISTQKKTYILKTRSSLAPKLSTNKKLHYSNTINENQIIKIFENYSIILGAGSFLFFIFFFFFDRLLTIWTFMHGKKSKEKRIFCLFFGETDNVMSINNIV